MPEMAYTDLPSILETTIGSIFLLALYFVCWKLTIGASRRRLIKDNSCKPVKMYPQKDPILGIDFFRSNSKNVKEHTLLESNLARFKQIGNTFRLCILGRQVILTIEPENLKAIQSLQFRNFSIGHRRVKAFRPLLGQGIFTTDGAAWQHSRELLRPNFVRAQVSDLNTFEQHVDHLIQAIPRDKSTVDLSELFFRLTMDSATEFLFGESTDCLAPGTSTESNARFAEAFNRSQYAVGNHARHGVLGFFLPDRQFNKDAKFVHDFVDAYVEKSLAYQKTKEAGERKGRYVFLHELATRTQDKLQIRSELLNVLLAGRDTTASLLSNVWFEIAKRPDIWAKLQAEISCLEGEKPSFEQIKEMKYLRYVLNESLRLYPVVPGNSREAIVDTVLPFGGGSNGKSPMFVPKGRVVGWSVYSMQRRKDYYGEDAEEFKPERWETLRPGWEYLPFNGGHRICIGQQFALTEASYTTVRLMQEFKGIESRDPEPWRESITLTCTSLNGTKVALTPR